MIKVGKKKSSLMAYFLNIGTPASPNWAPLGKGVVSLPIAYNPQTTTETYINEDNATTSVDSYQVSAGIDVALWDAVSAPAHAFLENLRKTRAVGSSAEVEVLEVDLSTNSPYASQKNAGVIAIDTFTVEGGKGQQLSQTIYFNGDPTSGTTTISNGTPAFTPSGVPALTVTSTPADAATAVAVGANIVLTFSNAIRAENITLQTNMGVLVSATKSWNATTKILTIDPDANLSAATKHLVTIAGVVDVYGQLLAPSVVDFTTA